MIGKSKKPSKAEVIRSIQSSKESDIAVLEPVSADSLERVQILLRKLLNGSSYASIIIITEK